MRLAKPASVSPPAGNNNGQNDSGDYDVWRAHFVQTAGSGSAIGPCSKDALPEPANLLPLMLGGGWLVSSARPGRKDISSNSLTRDTGQQSSTP